MNNAPTHCDECGKETSETYPSAGQNLCRECFDAAMADAQKGSVGNAVDHPSK